MDWMPYLMFKVERVCVCVFECVYIGKAVIIARTHTDAIKREPSWQYLKDLASKSRWILEKAQFGVKVAS